MGAVSGHVILGIVVQRCQEICVLRMVRVRERARVCVGCTSDAPVPLFRWAAHALRERLSSVPASYGLCERVGKSVRMCVLGECILRRRLAVRMLRADQVRERVRGCAVGADCDTLAAIVLSDMRVTCFIIFLTERSKPSSC